MDKNNQFRKIWKENIWKYSVSIYEKIDFLEEEKKLWDIKGLIGKSCDFIFGCRNNAVTFLALTLDFKF